MRVEKKVKANENEQLCAQHNLCDMSLYTQARQVHTKSYTCLTHNLLTPHNRMLLSCLPPYIVSCTSTTDSRDANLELTSCNS